jgi:hypothetical protein
MHDENSFNTTFGIGQHDGHKHKVHKSLLIHRKFSFLVSGCMISCAPKFVFNFESISNIIMPEKFRNQDSA